MGEDRTTYQNDRVLIDVKRILTPQFAGITIRIDGAQVELLRNIVSYLHQERTFVSEYHGTYYLTASDADFDDLSAIVADLEEKLMGNKNTIFGVSIRLHEFLDATKSGDGQFNVASTVVPAGEIHVVESASLSNYTRDAGISSITVSSAAGAHVIKGATTMTRYIPLLNDESIVLWAGDYIRFIVNTCLDNDDMRCGLWGYIMEIQD